MSRVTLNETYLSDTADAIRYKLGTLDTYTPAEFADAIESISGGESIVIVDTPDVGGGTIREITAAAGVRLHQKTGVNPTTSSQTIEPDEGYDGMTSVQINAVALQAKDNINPTTSSQTISPETGYLGLSSVQINAVASGSATTPATTITANPSISVSNTGLITATTSASQSVTPTVSAGYVSSGTAGTITVSGSNTEQLSTQGAQTITPTGSAQTIASGKYLTGTQTIEAVVTSNLTAANIKSGVTVKVGTATDDDSVASVTGTASGGGIGTLLATSSLGSQNITSTSATNINKSVSVSGINSYELLIVETSVDSVTNGRHIATVSMIFLTASSTVGTKNGTGIISNKMNMKASSNGTVTVAQSTTAYGIYPYSCTLNNGNATITMYGRYNSNNTGTINNTYTTRVYGVKLYDLVGG